MINNLTEGWYWLKNNPYDDKVIYRPIRVFVIKESGYYFGHRWYPPGTYIQMIGSDDVMSLSYFETGWTGVEFIKLEEPK